MTSDMIVFLFVAMIGLVVVVVYSRSLPPADYGRSYRMIRNSRWWF